MSFLIQYVADYAPWIYAICGGVSLYHIYRLWQVRAERRQAVFSLEREKAIRDLNSIFSVAMILLMIMGVTYFTSTTLSKALEPLVVEALSPTPGIPVLSTPTNTPLSVTPTPTVTPPAPAPETTVEVEAEEIELPEVIVEEIQVQEEPPTPVPAPVPQVVAPSCPDGRSVLLNPGVNETVNGVINLIGSSNHEQFDYYKIEYAPGANASGGFSFWDTGRSPVNAGFLAGLDTTALPNGQWTIRLVTVDQTGNFPPPCQVTININN